MKFKQQKNRRNERGNAISEFGPAMWILIICIFLPMINLLSLAVSYGMCMVLNHNQVHEAALLKSQQAQLATGPVKKGIPDFWLNGMGKLVKVQGYPRTSVSYRNELGGSGVSDKFVRVQTTINCSPLLTIPLPVVNVPGINGPMSFTLSSERPMENPDYAP